jgi:hypothetical protein
MKLGKGAVLHLSIQIQEFGAVKGIEENYKM